MKCLPSAVAVAIRSTGSLFRLDLTTELIPVVALLYPMHRQSPTGRPRWPHSETVTPVRLDHNAPNSGRCQGHSGHSRYRRHFTNNSVYIQTVVLDEIFPIAPCAIKASTRNFDHYQRGVRKFQGLHPRQWHPLRNGSRLAPRVTPPEE